MKAKLLKKLRRRFVIHKRNAEYMAFDRAMINTWSAWGSLDQALSNRREWILGEARKHKGPKDYDAI